ncbi:MAG: response regulator [Bacteroidota bacterium]|jgi:two-component system chemotaxis response regulator CheY|nr:response regulator [Ignavibacteria bacterium]HEX2960358.1 response regulator [Ignavibacteriales bacterium]MCU7499294.1 response regulator [Ignavibacteria bacterium]MCU7512523.1 response regulator [Ignavibacteria bacterium]MCU7519699.1 response regulator [Ignavibacteria bacterium]
MKKVILIADDSPTIRKFVSFSLTMHGFEVVSACDGMEAMEKLPAHKIDLVITDLNMPNLDGFELIKTIRGNEEYKDIPIIILSSLSGSEDVEKGMSYGASSYLVKPFDPKRIHYEVSKYLN